MGKTFKFANWQTAKLAEGNGMFTTNWCSISSIHSPQPPSSARPRTPVRLKEGRVAPHRLFLGRWSMADLKRDFILWDLSNTYYIDLYCI